MIESFTLNYDIKNTVFSPCLCPRASYPPLLSRARKSRSDIRVKTPAMAGEYTEYTSLLQDMGAAIAAAERGWKNFIDTVLTDTACSLWAVIETEEQHIN